MKEQTYVPPPKLPYTIFEARCGQCGYIRCQTAYRPPPMPCPFCDNGTALLHFRQVGHALRFMDLWAFKPIGAYGYTVQHSDKLQRLMRRVPSGMARSKRRKRR